MKVDLHIHSIYSDSSRSPEEIVALAKKRNVGLLSICDHATIGAYSVLPEICRDNGMNYVLGVELEILWKGESLHMLAYNFDPNDAQMKTFMDKQYRAIECEYIVYNMMQDYPQMSLEEYRHFAYPKEKGGWKYLYYAVEKGAAKTYEEANETIYSRYGMPNHLSDFGECNISDFCEMVKRAGGVPVLAHPGYLYERNPGGFASMLGEMRGCGLGGIECYYPSHTKDATDIFVQFCQENDMRITGGCDCHGEFNKSKGFSVGALEISLPMLDLKGIL